jgi:ADP-ribosyl-[dinitrogen reductase] hydrolase
VAIQHCPRELLVAPDSAAGAIQHCLRELLARITPPRLASPLRTATLRAMSDPQPPREPPADTDGAGPEDAATEGAGAETSEEDRSQAAAPEPNTRILARLFEEGRIALERSPLLDEPPPALERDDLGDRIEGMLLGLAIGDALGNTSEGMTPQMRAMTHGEIRDYLPNVRARSRPVGLPSDDTQLAFRTVAQMLEEGRVVVERLAHRFVYDPITGIGGTVAAFVHNYRDLGKPWYEAGLQSAGNGALMRIAPVMLPYLREPSAELWADTAVAAMLTHNDRASTAACIALVRTLWETLRLDSAPDADWWIETFTGTMRPLEGDTAYRPRTLRLTYEGPVSEFAAEEVRRALAQNLAAADACEEWLSGAYLLETIPSVLYILCRYAGDAERAIVRAVNDTVDNDTIGAVVGALVVALHRRAARPERVVEGRARQVDVLRYTPP